ncbi:aggregation-promoting factor C-terminal-like domain-containing protein [Jatrophihabitans sp. DSM 45814]
MALSINGKGRVIVTANHTGHIYLGTLTLGYGRYTVSARALNVGAGTASPVLGSRLVTLYNPATRNPRGTGYLTRYGSVLRLSGRVSDPDGPNSPLAVRVYDNGRLIAAGRTNGRTHAYAIRAQLGYGVNQLSVVALNIGIGNRNPSIGRFTLNRPRPWVDSYQGAQHIAATMVAAHGWGAGQMADLVKLWNKESGWRVSAANPSGAYGIPQALPGSKMAAAGPNWQSDARTQIAWGLSYIAGRYGSPSAAWAHSVATNWY